MTMQMKTNQSLQDVRQVFLNWRSCGNEGKHVPRDLKQMALDLLTRYPRSIVSESLGISRATLCNWASRDCKRSNAAVAADDDDDDGFVSVALDDNAIGALNASLSDALSPADRVFKRSTVMMKFPSGIELTIPDGSSDSGRDLIVSLLKEVEVSAC